MFYLYFLVLCYTSILLTPANSYVVVAANVNDFRSIAQKFVPKELVNQIKAVVLESGHKYHRRPSKYDEQVERTAEYEDISRLDDNSYELGPALKAALSSHLTNGYKLKRAPKVMFVETQPSQTQHETSDSVQSLNDIIKVILKDVSDTGNESGKVVEDEIKSVDVQVYNNAPNKYTKPASPKGQVWKPVYNSVPMKVLKEEIQFEATYEDADDKPQTQQFNNYYKPILNKAVSSSNNDYPLVYAKDILPKKNEYNNGKKVRFVKQVVVPDYSNQEKADQVSQTNSVQQSSFNQHSNLEPQLYMHQASVVQQSPPQQSNIAQQLASIQQQINQLTKTAQNTGSNKNPALQTPHLNIEAIDAHFHILPHESDKDEENKTNDSLEDHVEKATIDTLLSEETTAEPAVTEPSTKALTEPNVVENEQFFEEDVVISMENEEEATENKTEEIKITETKSKEVETAQDYVPELREVKVDNNARVGPETKVHTQEFGNTDAGEPIVKKTYNFNAPTDAKEADVIPERLDLPVSSARKVMLF